MSPRAAGSTSPQSLWAGHTLVEGQTLARFHRQSDRRRLKAMARGLFGVGLLVALILGVVGLRLQHVRMSYRLDGLRVQKAELEEARSRLRVELYTLKSLARIEGKARTELGMMAPARDQVQLAREFVPGGDGLSAAAPLKASAGELARSEAEAR